jgi:gluconokinase
MQGDGNALQVDLAAVSCFWHSLVGVNENGQAVTPLYGWADLRATNAVEQLKQQCAETEVHQRTGCRFHPSYWPAKFLWLRTEHADLYAQARTWMSFGEYFQLRLLGKTAASVSMASGTGLLSQQTCEWDSELLGLLDLSAEVLPNIARPGETFTKINPGHGLSWNNLNSARWFPAIGDGAASNIGAGCVTAASALVMIGTSGAMRIVYEGEPPAQLPPGLWCYRVDHRRVVVGGALSDGGGLYRWMRDRLVLFVSEAEMDSDLTALDADAHGLTVLPFWSGERSTGWNISARGAILGLRSNTEPLHILRATMEGIAYRFAFIAEALDSIAPQPSIIAAGNALLASPCWTQIIADVLGREVQLSTAGEASARGAALLALEAAGEIDLASVHLVCGRVFIPDVTRHEKYRAGRRRQQEAYDKLYGGLAIPK